MNNSTRHESLLRKKQRVFAIVGSGLALILIGSAVSLSLLEIEDVIYADGKIAAERPTDVVSPVSARVLELFVKEGDDVNAGDALARLDATPFEETLSDTESALRELEAECEVRKAQLAILEHNPLPKELWYAETNLKESQERLKRTDARLERLKGLLGKHAISQNEYEDAEIEHIRMTAETERCRENLRKVKSGYGDREIEKARRDIALVRARITGKRNTLQFVKRYLEQCTLTAPAPGRIISMPCMYSLYAEKGKPVATIAAGANTKGLAYVPEGRVRKIRAGQAVRVSSGVFSRLEYGIFSGRVDRVYDTPVTDARTKLAMYPVQISVYTQGRPLKLGSSAKFAIVAGSEPVVYSIFGLTREK